MKSLVIQYVQPNGDCALLFYFKNHPHKARRIQALAQYIRRQKVPEIIEVVPTSDSIMLVFKEPVEVRDDLMLAINDACQKSLVSDTTPQQHTIPVCYDPKLAPDLKQVLAQTGLSLPQLITHHTQPTYVVSFLGFLPGFAYLTGLCETLHLPRKTKPSAHTPAGSIAIANDQTGMYALNSPGGWHVIGRTPMSLISWQSDQPMRCQPLDYIRFEAIEYADFKQYQQ